MLNFKVDRVEGKRYKRDLYLSVPINLKISYDVFISGYEAVSINDEIKNAIVLFKRTRKIPFMLPVNGVEYPAYIEVQTSLLKIKGFRFVVGDTVVYSEGQIDTSAEPAIPILSRDLSNLEPKAPFKNPLLLFLILSMLPFIFSRNFVSEWNVPYKIAFNYFSTPILFLFIWATYKYPQKIDKYIFAGPSVLFSDKTKLISRYVMMLLIAVTTILFSGGWISAINVHLAPGTPVFIQGELQNSFNSQGWDISKVKANGRIYKIPIRSCMGLEGKKNFTVETALIQGALGILYIPTSDQDVSRLAAFYLRNATDSRWVRYNDYEFGSKLLSPAELKTMSEKWLEECSKGISTSCRVAAYFNSNSQYELLTKSCDGGDLTGCIGIYLLKDAKEAEKKNAVEKMYSGCLADSSTCECNWSLFEKNIDKQRYLAQEEKFCFSGERWACGAQYQRNKK